MSKLKDSKLIEVQNTFTTKDGFGGVYEVFVSVESGQRNFKLRSTSKASSLFQNDSDWYNSQSVMELGYYQAKGLSQDGFSDEQINAMFNVKQN